ncbi:MAG: DMT family transporter [Actinobacteria bacterium]|nr:DMT family transporter [Actinomycetota bacterium]
MTELKPFQAYGMIVFAAIMWGSLGVMTKVLYGLGLDPWSLTFYRTSMGFLSFAVVVLATSRSSLRVRREDLLFLAVYGLVSTSAFHTLYLYTISITSVAVAAVLLYTAPGFSAIMARFVFGEPLNSSKVIALLLAFGGCILVSGIESGAPAATPMGIATGLGSAVTYASFGIMGKRARQQYDPWTVNFYCMGFATIFLIPLLAVPGSSMGPYPLEAWMLLAVVAVGPTMLSRLLYVSAVKHVEASRAAIAATIEPASAGIFALIFLGELLSPIQIVGGILVLAGAVLAQRPSR